MCGGRTQLASTPPSATSSGCLPRTLYSRCAVLAVPQLLVSTNPHATLSHLHASPLKFILAEIILDSHRADCPQAQAKGINLNDSSAASAYVVWVQLYTSGSTGKPKGVEHTTGGYMVGAATTFKYVFDYRPDDIYWCTADCGWITGHSYVTYGELHRKCTPLLISFCLSR